MATWDRIAEKTLNLSKEQQDQARLGKALASRVATGMRVVPLTLGIARDLARVPWRAVPDMPDRIVAATALHLGLPLVSRDGRIEAPGLEVVW